METCGRLIVGAVCCGLATCATISGAENGVAESRFVQLFSQKFYAEHEEDGTAAYLSTSWCAFFLPTMKGSRRCDVDGRTILLHGRMGEGDVERIEIVELTSDHITLRFPDVEALQTFYRLPERARKRVESEGGSDGRDVKR